MRDACVRIPQTTNMPSATITHGRLAAKTKKPNGNARHMVHGALYLLALYSWWYVCGYYFGIGSSDQALHVQAEADPQLECHRMRVAYEVTPGRGWGKLPEALQTRWKEVDCERFDEVGGAEAGLMAASTTAAAAATDLQPPPLLPSSMMTCAARERR